MALTEPFSVPYYTCEVLSRFTVNTATKVGTP